MKPIWTRVVKSTVEILEGNLDAQMRDYTDQDTRDKLNGHYSMYDFFDQWLDTDVSISRHVFQYIRASKKL